jgi:phosphoglycerol transferase MdoB-like AlkP superfamily enzyme
MQPASGLPRHQESILLSEISASSSPGGRGLSAGYLRARRFLHGPRVRPLWLLAIYAYVLFTAFRLGLLLITIAMYPGAPWAGLGGADLLRCFVVGFGFDSMAVGYALLPMGVALSVVSVKQLAGKRFQRWIGLYAAAVSVYLLALEIVGAVFFLHYGARTDWRLAYYTQSGSEVWGYLFNEYYIGAWMLLVPVLVYGFYRFYRAKFWTGETTPLPGWRRPAALAGVLGLCVLACRGGLDSRPLNCSKAYFTANNVLSQLAMNNNYTLYDGTKSVFDENGEDEKDRFDLPDRDTATPVVESMLWQPQDHRAGGAGNPLWRRTVTGKTMERPNIVLIIMESMAGKHIGAMGYPHSQTPHLDAISREGLFFSGMYAVGAQTSRGLVGTMCGHPDLSGRTVLARRHAQGRFLTLPAMLQERGYNTVFLSCGKPSFDSMDVFFSVGGVDRLIGESEMGALPASNWGVHDEYVYDKAIETFGQIHRRGKQPFFGMILTISNHEPYEAPAGRVALLAGEDKETRVINATRYADWAMGRFFREASGQPWFKDTLFVLVADTGRQLEVDRTRLIDAMGFRVPCVFYAPGRIQPDVVPTVGSQTDIAPTLLAMLGGEYEHCFLGRNLLAVEPDDGFALLHQYDRLGFVRGDRLMVLPPRQQPPILYQLNGHAMHRLHEAQVDQDRMLRMKRDMLSLYSMAWLLYKDGLYRAPHDAAAEPALTTAR